MNIQLIGGIKGEIKSETQDNVLEIDLDDIFDDDSDDDSGPFDLDINEDELGYKKQQLKQSDNDKTEIPKPEKVSQLDCAADTGENTNAFKIKDNLHVEEKLVLNYTSKDFVVKNKQNERKEAEKNIDGSGQYWKLVEGTKVKVTPVPTSCVFPHEYVVEGLNKYRCNHCQFVTKYKKSVTKHIRYNHRNVTKTYQCPYCPYKSKHSPRSHIISMHKSENEVKWLKCDKCDYKSKLKVHLTRHLLSHMDPNQMMDRMKKCDRCPKMFKFNKGLKRHKLLVHEKHTLTKLKCTECQYECFLSYQLKRHKEAIHSDTENIKCLYCPKCSFKTKSKCSFKQHVANHEKVTCEKCAYQTESMYRLKLHMINHKEVKDDDDLKYRCDKCDYKTYRVYSLKVHQLNHLKPEEVQYFYCYHCEFKTKRKDNLKRHLLRHFEHNEIPFQCFICDFSTIKRDILISHITKHSNEIEEKMILLPSG